MTEPVAIVRCPDYDPARVADSLARALDLVGGIERVVRPGQTVLLKVNLLNVAPPDHAVTTHPAVVEAMARAVQAAGGSPIIADSPGGQMRYTPSTLERLYDVTGMAGVAERTGAALNFDTSAREVVFPEGRLMKRARVIVPVLDADVVISLPKLKTHGLTAYTGATKNLFGVIPGADKVMLHATPRTLANFAGMLLDILRFIRPALTLMDAVVGMEGNGPSAGRPKPIGLLLAGTDGVALDVVATQIVGIPPAGVPTLQQAVARGWWSGRTEDVPTLGESLDAVHVSDFVPARPNRHPEGINGLPLLDRLIAPTLVSLLAVRPVPHRDRCTGCGTCLRACPRDAIRIHNRIADVNYGRCIRCYCCHEMCPEHAIDLTPTRLGALLGAGSRHRP